MGTGTGTGDAILALDLGTTSCKAVLVGSDGSVLARAAEDVATRRPALGFAEQDADEVVAAAAAAVRAVAARGVVPRGLALSSAMHSMLAVDDGGRPLFAARTWADARGADVAARWRVEGADRELLRRTGTPVHASSPACKIAHLRAAEPAVFARAARFCSLKEYVCARWLGAWVVDESIASSSGLFDLERRSWCDDALARAGIDRDRLGELVPTDRVVGELGGAIAGELSLPSGLPVVVGASDGVLQNLGVGAVGPGSAALNVGTSAAVRAVVASPGEHAELGLFCYVLDRERFVVGGAVNNAGLVVDWLGEVLFAGADDPHRAVLEAAAASAPGAGGVRCRPLLTGERFPDYDSSSRARFDGIALDHGRPELCRSALEGVARSVAAIADAVAARCGTLRELRGGGGLLRSELVATLVADACRVPVSVGPTVESSALGAARLAASSLGLRSAEPMREVRTFEPSAEGER